MSNLNIVPNSEYSYNTLSCEVLVTLVLTPILHCHLASSNSQYVHFPGVFTSHLFSTQNSINGFPSQVASNLFKKSNQSPLDNIIFFKK